MSSSYSCEIKLREIADELQHQADELLRAADVLEALRDAEGQQMRIEDAKKWAKDWMERK